jgi:hypothetical protein
VYLAARHRGGSDPGWRKLKALSQWRGGSIAANNGGYGGGGGIINGQQ